MKNMKNRLRRVAGGAGVVRRHGREFRGSGITRAAWERRDFWDVAGRCGDCRLMGVAGVEGIHRRGASEDTDVAGRWSVRGRAGGIVDRFGVRGEALGRVDPGSGLGDEEQSSPFGPCRLAPESDLKDCPHEAFFRQSMISKAACQPEFESQVHDLLLFVRQPEIGPNGNYF